MTSRTVLRAPLLLKAVEQLLHAKRFVCDGGKVLFSKH